MANPSAAHEPSMEEILASIRQIISEDGEGAPAPRTSEADPVQEKPEPLPRKEASPPAAASEAKPSSIPAGTETEAATAKQPDNGAQATQRPPAPVPAPQEPRRTDFGPPFSERQAYAPPRSNYESEDRHLLSQQSDAAVSGAFSALAHTILAQNARTLEDIVAEMLRPMLKEWLDDNLPPLVERLVQEEIQRVSRGRR
jgi:cell pole-organizing protein PopZ